MGKDLTTQEEDKRQAPPARCGPKWYEFQEKLKELLSKDDDVLVPRHVRNSTYFRELPLYQGFLTQAGLFWFVFRKLPFQNPGIRVFFFIMGIDLFQSIRHYRYLWDENAMQEVKVFDRLWQHLTVRTPYKVNNWKYESEDWYDMNKPAVRMPVPIESCMDRWMAHLALRGMFKQRPVQWEGDWEQEMHLKMDLHGPHGGDGWHVAH